MNKAYKKVSLKRMRETFCVPILSTVVNFKIHELASTRVFKRDDFSYSPYPSVNEAVCFLFHFTSQFVTLSALFSPVICGRV